MRIKQIIFPLMVAVITAVLFAYSLNAGDMFAAYVALTIGGGILVTLYAVEDAERDERDVWNAGRASIATVKTVVTLGVITGAWLGAFGHSEGTVLAVFSFLCGLLWFLLYEYYNWREVS